MWLCGYFSNVVFMGTLRKTNWFRAKAECVKEKYCRNQEWVSTNQWLSPLFPFDFKVGYCVGKSPTLGLVLTLSCTFGCSFYMVYNNSFVDMWDIFCFDHFSSQLKTFNSIFKNYMMYRDYFQLKKIESIQEIEYLF